MSGKNRVLVPFVKWHQYQEPMSVDRTRIIAIINTD